jgi:hypothetical protein
MIVKKKDIEVKRNSVKDIFFKITMINNMQYNTHKIKLALNNQSYKIMDKRMIYRFKHFNTYTN